MKILGIESSAMTASVAVWEDELIIAEYSTNFKKTHSQTLLPMLEEIKTRINLDVNTVDAIAVSAGPGSFTGLRIGSATAKGIGMALNIPIVPVPTLDALAYNVWGVEDYVCPLMDARRNQTYTACYFYKEGNLEIESPQDAKDIEKVIEECNARGKKTLFLGDGVPVFEKILKEKLSIPFSFAPAHMNRQRAASLAVLGAVYYRQGRMESSMEHAPIYLRVSQAEREKEERELNNT